MSDSLGMVLDRGVKEKTLKKAARVKKGLAQDPYAPSRLKMGYLPRMGVYDKRNKLFFPT